MNAIVKIYRTGSLVSIVAGVMAVICAFGGRDALWGLDGFAWAWIFIGIAAVADFLDGFAARTLHTYSSLGKELDSLCDLVSFGVAPAMIMFNCMEAVGSPGMGAVARAAYSRGGSIASGQVQHRHPPDHRFHRPSHPRKRHLLDRILFPLSRGYRISRRMVLVCGNLDSGKLAYGFPCATFLPQVQDVGMEGKPVALDDNHHRPGAGFLYGSLRAALAYRGVSSLWPVRHEEINLFHDIIRY